MEASMFEGALSEALRISFLLSVVPLGAAVLIGFIVSFIQSAIQIQEQSIPFTIKLLVIGGIIFIFGNSAMNILCTMTQEFISSSAVIGLNE